MTARVSMAHRMFSAGVTVAWYRWALVMPLRRARPAADGADAAS